MKKKGFPESYDMHRLVKFVSDLKSGVPNVTAPVYSHLIYDVDRVDNPSRSVRHLTLQELKYQAEQPFYLHTIHIMYLFLILSIFRYMLMLRKTYFRHGISTVF